MRGGYNLNVMQQSACLVLTQSWLITMPSWFCRSYLYADWPNGVQLVLLFVFLFFRSGNFFLIASFPGHCLHLPLGKVSNTVHTIFTQIFSGPTYFRSILAF